MKSNLSLVLMIAAALAVGCKSNKKQQDTSPMPAAGTLNVPSAPAVSYTPPPAPQPLVHDTPQQREQPVIGEEPVADASDEISLTSTSSYAPAAAPRKASAARGSRYTVKKGESLWSIAQSKYGNGNQWQKLCSANPGLTETNLKAGQTISIPQ